MSNNILIFVKLIVAPFGLVWLITSLITTQLIPDVELNWRMIAGAMVLNQLALIMFALRMRVALRAFSIDVSLSQAHRIHLQSMLYFFVLPMTVGLEAARFGKIKHLLADKASGGGLASGLFADRIIGALAAVLLAIAVWPIIDFKLPLNWDQSKALPWLLVGAVLALGVPVGLKLLRSIPSLDPVPLPDLGRLATALSVALATHLLFALGIYVAALGANLGIDFPQSLFVISASMIFVLIPVSFAGVGPVEGAGLTLLVGLGVSLEAAALFVTAVYVAKLIAAIEGAVWEFIDGARDQMKRKPATD